LICFGRSVSSEVAGPRARKESCVHVSAPPSCLATLMCEKSTEPSGGGTPMPSLSSPDAAALAAARVCVVEGRGGWRRRRRGSMSGARTSDGATAAAARGRVARRCIVLRSLGIRGWEGARDVSACAHPRRVSSSGGTRAKTESRMTVTVTLYSLALPSNNKDPISYYHIACIPGRIIALLAAFRAFYQSEIGYAGGP
jgi:hypothetical protein